MVVQVNGPQMKRVIEDCFERGLDLLRVPEPVCRATFTPFCERVAADDSGLCYAWIDGQHASGFLVASVFQDPLTGSLDGGEFFWWVSPACRGEASLSLLQRFEDDCRARGCRRVIMGYHEYLRGPTMRRMYRRLGYAVHSGSVTKEL